MTTHGGSRGIECDEHILDYFEQQVERIDTQVTALYAGQHRRQSHLAAHRANRRDLGASDSVFGERIRQNMVRSVQGPPTYITKTLGPARQSRRRAAPGSAPSSPSRRTASYTT